MRLIGFLVMCIAWTMPTWAHDTHKHEGTEILQPGDVGFEHKKYHEPYKRLTIEVNGGPGLSDEGYMSDQFGPTYKKLYQGGKCNCKSGYCRPSRWRFTQLDSPTGYDILVNRTWVPVPEGTLHHENSLSPELWDELMATADAHVCAYPDQYQPYGYRIECAILPKNVG